MTERGDIGYKHLFKFVPVGEDENHKVFGNFEAQSDQPVFLQKAITYGLDKQLLEAMKTAIDRNVKVETDESYY